MGAGDGWKEVMSVTLKAALLAPLTWVSQSCLLADWMEASVNTALRDRGLWFGDPCREENSGLLLGDAHQFVFGVANHTCLLSTRCMVSPVTGGDGQSNPGAPLGAEEAVAQT